MSDEFFIVHNLDKLRNHNDCVMLHAMFTRKKQLVIQPYEKGFKVSCPAQNIDVYCDDVRDGISQVLDNLVAIRCMS